MEMNYAALVDGTNFGTVRRYLARAKSPITNVLFVASRDLLAQVADLLDGSGGQSPSLRRVHLEILLQSGRLCPGADRDGVGVDMSAIPDDWLCHAIYLPPVYLVHIPGLNLKLPRAEREWPSDA